MLVCEKLLYIAESLGVPRHNTYEHTDSLVSMHWICTNKNKLKLYVSIRLPKVQQTIIQILFLPGKFNPADLVSKTHASKGCINSKFWTTGPAFLQQENNDWFEKNKLEEVKQNSDPETKINDYQTEFRQIPEASIFKCKITPAIPS